jgi:DNA-directed RNA polymerase subunit F
MIIERKPLSMVEAKEHMDKDSGTDIMGFVKKFVVLKPEKAKELKKKIQDLDLLKVKEEHITKIIDIMPETVEDINKIFNDVSLDEDETKKLLETIKEFK